MTKTCLLRTLACLAPAFSAGLHAQELISNGNFEGATLAPWEVSAPAGTSITLANESSPYRSQYPAGTRAARLQDDDVEFETPFFRQSFSGRGGIQFSFDFKSPTTPAPGSAWYVIWKGENDTTAFFFAIGGNDGVSLILNQTSVATLEPNMWYHLEGSANAPAQTLTGSVVNTRGERTTFSGGFPFGVQSVINGLTITDGDQGMNEPILFDNFSAQPGAVVLPALQITRAAGGQVTVSWNVAGYTLQASSAVGAGAQWTSIPTAVQSFTTGTDDPMQFFRLISN